MMARVALSVAVLLGAVPAAEARCFIRGRFQLNNEGPWPYFVTVDSGTACLNRNFSSRGALFKRLNALELPAHGKVALRQGGHYDYVPNPGYRGPDRFVLQICGEWSGGAGCATLNYEVKVE